MNEPKKTCQVCEIAFQAFRILMFFFLFTFVITLLSTRLTIAPIDLLVELIRNAENKIKGVINVNMNN